jgi:hypothetical protein
VSTTLGRHFVATRDVAPLEEILVDSVAVLGPATKTVPICLECLQPNLLDGKKNQGDLRTVFNNMVCP